MIKLKIKKFFSTFLIFSIFITVSACSKSESKTVSEASSSELISNAETNDDTNITSTKTSVNLTSILKDSISSDDTNTIFEKYSNIDLTSLSSKSESVVISKNVITINKEGTYKLSGNNDNASIVVDTDDEKTVYILFDNISLTSKTSAPIYIKNAKKVVIHLLDGTTNTLSDTVDMIYTNEDKKEPNSTIFSKSDLTINGKGKLIVNALFNNAISSNDNLLILDGEYEVNSTNNAIKGKDLLAIIDGNFTINSKGDALQADNNTDDELGNIIISNGNFTIESNSDAIQAENSLLVNKGTFNIKTGSKALKSGLNISIIDGVFDIISTDDSIHSNNSITIENGDFVINSSDDGIHSDTILTINSGKILINDSYEGLESSTINIIGGDISITSKDDGINAASGNDNSATTGRENKSNFSSGTGIISISGGKIYINSSGDGVDSNGKIIVSGGEIIVDGPENNGNGALDYDSEFTMAKGTFLAIGSSGMAQSISDTSEVFSITVTTQTTIQKNTLIEIKDSNDNILFKYNSAKSFSSIVFANEDIKSGETYSVYLDGTKEGEVLISDINNYIGTNVSNNHMGGGNFNGERPDDFKKPGEVN